MVLEADVKKTVSGTTGRPKTRKWTWTLFRNELVVKRARIQAAKAEI